MMRTQDNTLFILNTQQPCRGFPGGSVGKESTCDAGDLGVVPGWEDPLAKGMAAHSSILAWRMPMDRGAWWATAHGFAKSLA